jgi:predicted DNA-binding transcriptional regulator YafY
VRDVALSDERFSPDPGYDFDSFARKHFRIMGDGQSARVRIWFAPEAALYVRERTWHPTQVVTDAGGGAVELAMEVDGLVEVASWVLSFGPRARAIEPPELVARVTVELRGALAHHEPPPPGGAPPARGRKKGMAV